MEDKNFEEMRQQIGILKMKLDKQDIINDRLMHEVINTKTQSMKRSMMVSICCAVFVIITCPFSFHYTLGVSWWFIGATVTLMLYCMLRELEYKHRISNRVMMSASILEVARIMASFKSSYRRYTFCNFVLLILWVVWLVYEVYLQNIVNPELFRSICEGLGIGVFVGSIIGLRKYLHIQDTASEIIRQIDE